jgi:hypothetical protein
MPDQTVFRAALLDAERPVPEGLLDGFGSSAGRRYSVYRNNVAVSLTEALRESFPVLRKLLGDQNFDALAGVFLRAHPPGSPLMMHYGDEMPEFLTGFAPLQHIGYLPDVARLENALRASYHAGDAEPVDPTRLAGHAPEDLVASTLSFAPSLCLIRSPWPLFDIWRFNTEEGAPKPRAEAQSVLVTRAEFDPEPAPLSPAEAAAMQALLDQKTISHAVIAGEAEDTAFDISPLLGRLVSQNAVTDLTT